MGGKVKSDRLLGYLKDFPFTRLKLDRSFIICIDTEPNDAIIIGAAIRLAHDLGLDVVAEGVEDEKQVACLSRLNCDVIQGYYFSKPLPTELAEAFIRERNSIPALPGRAAIPPIDVMVIDDDLWICKFLVGVFSELGHSATFDTDSIHGLETLCQNPDKYDLILIDMLLPKMSGIDLIKGIRDCYRDTPIIVITAFNQDHVHRALKPIEKECNLIPEINYLVIEKPLTADAISRIVKRLFSHQNSGK